MSRRSKWNAEQKYTILQEHENGQFTWSELAKLYQLNLSTLKSWKQKFDKLGMDGLSSQPRNLSYSAELKRQVVHDYVSGMYSQQELCFKYNIKNRSQVLNWVQKYNGHSELKSYSGGRDSMTIGRTTTWQERIEIAMYCIEHQHNYHKTADTFQVSYQQVYQWVKKYESGGQDALQDGRGKKHSPEILTMEQQHAIDRKKLEHENERLRAENAILKKLWDMQRGRR
jgi:transposase